jgi:hypothetical protein
VHTGPEADELNQQLQAKAFTTGPDIFFRRGEYNPGSSGSRELIAHELSHVVQQSSRVLSSDASGMSVRPAGDAFEQEAESVGHAVSEARSKTTHAMGGEGASNKGGRHPFVQRAPLPPRQVSPAVYRVGNDGTVHAMIDQANQILAQANIRIVAKSESEVDPGSLKDALKARMKYVAEATKGWDKEVYWKRVDGLSWGDDKGLRECWETFNDEVKLDLWHEAVVARLPELPDNSLAIVSSNIERGAFFGAPAEGVFGKTWRQDTQNKYIKHIFKIPEGKAVDTQKAICFVYPNNIRPGQAGETLAHELGHALLNSGEHVVLGRWLAKWWDRRRLMAEGGARTGTRLTPAEIASMRKSPYVTKPT